MGKAKEAVEFAKHHIKKAPALLGVVAIAGCGGYTTSKQTAEKIAEKQYQQAYKGSSPTGKFALQYLLESKTGVHNTAGDGGATDWVITFNSGCLGGSSYNTSGGSIQVSASAEAGGFLSVARAEASVNAQIPVASAYWDWSPKDPNKMTIHPGNPNASVLHFTNVEGAGPLSPVDQQTKDKLEGAGCKQGIINEQVIDNPDSPGPGNEPISPWMHWSDGRTP